MTAKAILMIAPYPDFLFERPDFGQSRHMLSTDTNFSIKRSTSNRGAIEITN